MGRTKINPVEGDNQEDEDQKGQIDKFDQLGNFYQKFANKLEIFDPLDRPIPFEDRDEAMKRE
jgi:hypothetical protein